MRKIQTKFGIWPVTKRNNYIG